MKSWNRYFLDGIDQPVIGMSEAELRSIRAPAFIVPGNDNSHPRPVAENLSRLLPDAEFQVVVEKHYDMDVGPREEWDARDGELAAHFVDFMQRMEKKPRQ